MYHSHPSLLDCCVSDSVHPSSPTSHLLASPEWVRGDVLPHVTLSLQQHGGMLSPHRYGSACLGSRRGHPQKYVF